MLYRRSALLDSGSPTGSTLLNPGISSGTDQGIPTRRHVRRTLFQNHFPLSNFLNRVKNRTRCDPTPRGSLSISSLIQTRLLSDRTNSGKVSFEKGFAKRHTAPRFSTQPNMDMTLIIDDSSIELFADNGMTTMTHIFFPNKPYTDLTIESKGGFTIDKLQVTALKNIWRK